MPREENPVLEARVEALEHRLRRSRRLTFAAFALAGLAACIGTTERLNAEAEAADVLHLRGLVIEDAAGRPRIVMGAPAPQLVGRRRKDELMGIAYLGENGADRLTFGQKPDPMTTEGIKERRTGGTGILIHDRNGAERGGYGVLDDGSAVLTLDWPHGGEGWSALSSADFTGTAVWYRSPLGVYREAITIGAIPDRNAAFLKWSDPGGHQRLRLESEGNKLPVLSFYNEEGAQVRSRPVR